MQYASVALPVKTRTRQELFTYTIPPELLADIKVGQRVIVPWRASKVVGTILELRIRPPKIKAQLKPIFKLAEPFSFFDKKYLDFAEEAAGHYGATVGQILEVAGPKIAPRVARKLTVMPLYTKSINKTGQIYGLYKNCDERYEDYLDLIKQASKKGKNSLVLFPSQELAIDFTEILTRQNIEHLLLPESQGYSQFYATWCQALAVPPRVVVGTRRAVWLDLPSCGLVIVDRPSIYGYKEEQSPYYHALTVAKIKSRYYPFNLIVGDVQPRLNEWFESKQAKLKLIKPLRSSIDPANITILDSTGARTLFNVDLLDKMQQALDKKQKIAIYYNRKGEGLLYRCLECETAITCNICNRYLRPTKRNGKEILYCPKDKKYQNVPYRCEICGSYRLGSSGLGIESIKETLKNNLHGAENILVTTSQILFQPVAKQFDVLYIMSLDQLLHSARYDLAEEAFLLLGQLSELTEKIVIVTKDPDHPVIQGFCQDNPDHFYQSELASRKNEHYPPVQPITKLILVAGQDNADELYKKLNAKYLVFPPKRVNSRYQIVVKSGLTKELLSMVPGDWLIDPEPESLD